MLRYGIRTRIRYGIRTRIRYGFGRVRPHSVHRRVTEFGMEFVSVFVQT